MMHGGNLKLKFCTDVYNITHSCYMPR